MGVYRPDADRPHTIGRRVEDSNLEDLMRLYQLSFIVISVALIFVAPTIRAEDKPRIEKVDIEDTIYRPGDTIHFRLKLSPPALLKELSGCLWGKRSGGIISSVHDNWVKPDENGWVSGEIRVPQYSQSAQPTLEFYLVSQAGERIRVVSGEDFPNLKFEGLKIDNMPPSLKVSPHKMEGERITIEWEATDNTGIDMVRAKLWVVDKEDKKRSIFDSYDGNYFRQGYGKISLHKPLNPAGNVVAEIYLDDVVGNRSTVHIPIPVVKVDSSPLRVTGHFITGGGRNKFFAELIAKGGGGVKEVTLAFGGEFYNLKCDERGICQGSFDLPGVRSESGILKFTVLGKDGSQEVLTVNIKDYRVLARLPVATVPEVKELEIRKKPISGRERQATTRKSGH